jgi:anti-sigma B factor antagonist
MLITATRASLPAREVKRACPRADVGAPTRVADAADHRPYGAAVDGRAKDRRERTARSMAHRDRAVTGAAPGAFGIEDAELGGAPGVAIHGEVDLSAVPLLVEALDAAVRESAGAFVIDLCDVEFLDSSGLSALMRARAMLGREERPLAVVCPPGPLRRLFNVAGVADLFSLYASREEAAAALVPPD